MLLMDMYDGKTCLRILIRVKYRNKVCMLWFYYYTVIIYTMFVAVAQLWAILENHKIPQLLYYSHTS